MQARQHITPMGGGYLCIAVCTKGESQSSHFMLHSYHTPLIPITVLSPGITVHGNPMRFYAHTVHTKHVTGKGYAQFHGIGRNKDTQIPGITRAILLYTQDIRPESTMHVDGPIVHLQEKNDVMDLYHISAGAKRIIWHQRLGRINFCKLSELHKHVDGVPRTAMPSDVDNCMTFWACKIKRVARGSADTRKDAILIKEGISVDWGLIFQGSKTKGRYEKLVGINNETAYLIIADHATDVLWGVSSNGKGSPIDWFSQYDQRDMIHK
jgi:hypothetical protein